MSSVKVLVLEDNGEKYGKIVAALEAAGVQRPTIKHAFSMIEAMEAMRDDRFDLLLLDINVPRRPGAPVARGGGLALLRDLARMPDVVTPRYVVGITAFDDVVAEFGGEFTDRLWSLIGYAEDSDRWVSQLSAKIEYIEAVLRSDAFRDGRTYGADLALICAIEGVEFDAIRKLDCTWQPLGLAHDETRLLSGTLETKGRRRLSVLAASASRMGMPASAVLASKIIHNFRPRMLVMVGICAGRAHEVNLGDILVADPSWDYGSGKIIGDATKPSFRPSPHQIEVDTDLRPVLLEVGSDVAELAKIRARAPGKKPETELKVHVGPLASGAAVVAHKPTLDALILQHRKLLGIDMEAYGVAAACLGSGKPRPICLVAKGVSDFADARKKDDFQEYAASVSAQFALEAALRFLS